MSNGYAKTFSIKQLPQIHRFYKRKDKFRRWSVAICRGLDSVNPKSLQSRLCNWKLLLHSSYHSEYFYHFKMISKINLLLFRLVFTSMFLSTAICSHWFCTCSSETCLDRSYCILWAFVNALHSNRDQFSLSFLSIRHTYSKEVEWLGNGTGLLAWFSIAYPIAVIHNWFAHNFECLSVQVSFTT